MNQRPYPNADRALRHVRRHHPEDPELLAAERQAFVAAEADYVLSAQIGREADAPPVDEYRLSTRPGVVSGDA